MSDSKLQVKAFQKVYETKSQELIDLKKSMNSELAEIFTKLCKSVFEENPNIEAFAWYQGDSGWNDGDPTYFFKRETLILHKGKYKDFKKALEESYLEDCFDWDPIGEIFDSLPESFYGEMFGSDAQYLVILTREGIEVLNT